MCRDWNRSILWHIHWQNPILSPISIDCFPVVIKAVSVCPLLSKLFLTCFVYVFLFFLGKCMGSAVGACYNTYMGKIPSYRPLLLCVPCIKQSCQCVSAGVKVIFDVFRIRIVLATVCGLQLEQAMTHTWEKFFPVAYKNIVPLLCSSP